MFGRVAPGPRPSSFKIHAKSSAEVHFFSISPQSVLENTTILHVYMAEYGSSRFSADGSPAVEEQQQQQEEEEEAEAEALV